MKKLCLLLTTLVFVSCEEAPPPPVSVDGQAFIVTNGRDTIELSMMDIKLYPAEAVREFVEERQATIESTVLEMEEEFAQINSQVGILGDQLVELKVDQRERTLLREELKEKTNSSLTPSATKIELIEEQRKILQDERTAMAKIEEVTVQRNNLMDQAVSLRDKIDKFKSAEAVFYGDFPAPVSTTTTNSEGKFSIQFEPGNDLILGAYAERKNGEITERYGWLIELGDTPPESLQLDNRSLIEFSEENRIIKSPPGS